MMETNPYEYDRSIPWIPQQNQFYQSSYVTTRTHQQPLQFPQRQQQRVAHQKPTSKQRMPKAQALALARTLKKGLVIASLVSFGTLSGLVAFHQIASTSGQSDTTSSGSSQSTSTSTSTSSSQNSNSFLNQQGGNNLGTSNSSQAPVSGSTVS